MPTEYSPQLKLTIGGTEVADTYQVSEVRVNLSLHAAHRIQVRFLDDDLSLIDSLPWSLGDEVAVEMSDPGGTLVAITKCELTSMTVEPSVGSSVEVVLAADDKRHRLMRGVNIRTFLDMTDADIASAIAGEYGLTADVSGGASHEYLLQTQSDGAFLTERCKAIGNRWWIDEKTLHFKPIEAATESTTLTWGETLTAFRVAVASAESSNATKVRSWDRDKQAAVAQEKAPKSDLAHVGSTASAVKKLIDQGPALATNDRFAGASPFPDASSGSKYAESLAKRAASTQLTARGETVGTPAVKAGANVTVEGLGKLDGDYLVTSADHIMSAETGYRTRFVCGSLDGDDLVDLLGPRSAGVAAGPWSAGQLVIGVVTNIEGEDSAVAKVQFPTLSADDESTWARIVSAGAGASRGLQIYPEVGDEVLVGFEHGDPSRPLILGGLWSKSNKSPLANSAAIKDKKVASRTWTSRLGHEITFNEGDSASDAKTTIVIAHADGKTKIELTPEKILITTPKETEFLADGDMKIKAKGDIALEGNNVKIKATSKVSIEGAEVTGKGQSKVAFQGAQAEVKGDATLKLEGGGMTEIKGGMVKLN